MTCTHRTVGRRPGCDADTSASLSAIQNVIGDFAGTAFYVDPNHTNAADANAGTSPELPLRTVQAAVNKCEDQRGDVIIVAANSAWSYDGSTTRPLWIQENVNLNKAGVRIIGLSAGPTGVFWVPASDGGTCITIRACDCVVEGFHFDEGNHTGCRGIFIIWDGLTNYGDNAEVRNCTFGEDCTEGIEIDYSWYSRIHHCYFDRPDYGIYLDPAGDATAYTEIDNNTFQRCSSGALSMAFANYCNIHDNVIVNTDAIAGNPATNEGINLNLGSVNVVHNNVLSCLLPVPDDGDYNDFCSPGISDAWINNLCMDGPTTGNPT